MGTHNIPKDPQRVSKLKKHLPELNIEGIDMPMKICNIKKFEKRNMDYSVNVYGIDKKSFYPIHLTDKINRKFHVNTLYIENKEEDESHDTYIKDINRLFSSNEANGHHKVY